VIGSSLMIDVMRMTLMVLGVDMLVCLVGSGVFGGVVNA